MTSYDRIAKYYDITQDLARYQMEARRMDSIFREHGVRTLLDLACGTGSHLIELAKLGYQCTGQDLSQGMIDVAQEKARTAGVKIDFVKGDIRSYHMDRVFDAVLGLYALTSLVDDEDFGAALASTRQALRTGGVFYFNGINSEARGPFPPGVTPPPMLFLGTAAKQADVKLVQFNNLVIQGDLWTRTAIYLIEDVGQTQLEIQEDHLQLRRLDDVKALLADHGFRFESVTYVDVMGYKQWDMHICAIAVDN